MEFGLFAAFVLLFVYLAGMATGMIIEEKETRLHALQLEREREWMREEFLNLENQLRLSDNSAEAWRAEAYARGYKPTRVDS